MSEYVNAVVDLVEKTYAVNNKQRVVLIGHSLGNLYMVYLLNRQSQKWKDTYIQTFISIGAPYGGSVKMMKMFASGWLLFTCYILSAFIMDIYYWHLLLIFIIVIYYWYVIFYWLWTCLFEYKLIKTILLYKMYDSIFITSILFGNGKGFF